MQYSLYIPMLFSYPHLELSFYLHTKHIYASIYVSGHITDTYII